MTVATQTIEPRTTPPFRAGEFVEIRGWRGTLEPGVNPFGASGRERLLVTDDLGIGYLHDPVTDILYASPRFSRESLDRAYQSPVSHLDVAAFRDVASWKAGGDRSYIVSRLKADLVRRYLPAGDRVLDVGCHVGLFVLLAQEAGLDACGIDVSAEAIRAGTEQLAVRGIRAVTLEAAGFAPESFDGIVVWDVLEHLHNLMEVMEHCATLLRPGGHFFAQVPNHRGVSARLKTLVCRLGLRGGRFHHFGFPWHLYHFSPRSLVALARRAGLEPALIRSFTHRTKDRGHGGGPLRWANDAVERLSLSDYLYVVARKQQRG